MVFCAIALLLAPLALLCVIAAVRGRKPRRLFAFLVLLAAVDAGIWFLAPQFPRRLKTGLQTNIAETAANPEFAELRTRSYTAPRERVWEAVNAAIASRPGKWSIVSTDPAAGAIHAAVKVVMFTDDVFVHVQGDGQATRVDARSQSRVGRGDFGENRRHIGTLLKDVDWYLR